MSRTHIAKIADNLVCRVRRAKSAVAIGSIFVATLLALLLPRTAHAQPFPYARQSQPATFVSRLGVYLPAGTYNFRTASPSAGGDPILHLLRDSPFSEVTHDDDGGGGVNSSLSVTVATAGNYTLIVRAYSSSAGTCNITQNGTTIYSAVPFGGTMVDVPTGNSYIYETAFRPGGSTDTYLFGLNTGGAIVAVDDDAGVGLASRITASNLRYVVIASYGTGSQGVVNFYVNDKSVTDSDQDGLGNQLEAALSTCAQFTCTGVVNGKDTDHDGLTDMAEVFGIDDAAFPQYLPQWGANPRHKDVFVEVDWIPDPSLPSRPFNENLAIEAATYLDTDHALALDVLNPDGTGGINLHLDIGITPPLSQVEAGDTRYGSWGGSAVIDTTVGEDSPPNFAAIRSLLFRHARFFAGDGGQTDPQPASTFGWGGSMGVNNTAGFMHELGHTFGLEHWGHNTWGAANCKPNYPSIMNYAFTWEPNFVFSTAQLSALTVNPASIPEDPAYPTNQSPSYLSGNPFFIATSGRRVDWNRDGTYSGGNLRAPATWASWAGCASFMAGSQVLNQGSSPVIFDTPKFVKFNNRLYLFSVTSAGALQYHQGPIGGQNDTGSCVGPAGTCVAWTSSPVTVSTNAMGISVAAWKNAVMITYRKTDGTIYSRYASTVDTSGNLTNWSPEIRVGTLDVSGAPGPELAIMYVNPANFGGVSEIASVFGARNGAYYVWTSPGLSGPWAAEKVVYKTNDSTMAGNIAPSIVSWPNRGGADHSAIGTSCGTFIDPSLNVRFFCYQKSTNRWQDLSSTMYAQKAMPRSATRTGLAYHVLRNSTGTPVGGNNWNGQFWMNVVPVDPVGTAELPQTFISSGLSAASASLYPGTSTTFVQKGIFWDAWQMARPSTSPGLYEDESLSAMKGVFINQLDNKMYFLPYADGSFPASLKDGNDFRVMERGICAQLHKSNGNAVCGASNKWGY